MFDRSDRQMLREIHQTQALILQKLCAVIQKEIDMAGELDALKNEVSRNTDVDQSAITLLNGLAQKLQDAINAGDPAALQALADTMKGSSDALAAAVVANTPAA